MIQKTDINPKTNKQYAVNPGSGLWDDNYWAQQVDPVVNASEKASEKARVDRENLITKQKGEQSAFLGRYTTGINDARTALTSELGLPDLRQTTQMAGQSARDVSRMVQDVAPTQQTIAKQVGISAPHLQSRIASETGKLAPTVETARRSLEDATANQQFGETEYTRRLQEYTQPFQMEASMLSESLAREFTGFTDQMQNELTVTLQKLEQGHQLSMAEIERASQLAASEKDFERQKQLVILGTDENIRQSKALKSINGSGTGVNLGAYLPTKPTTTTPATPKVSLMGTWDSVMGGSNNSPIPGLTFDSRPVTTDIRYKS